MPKKEYGNTSISVLEGADRVRKRPGVIFGSDGLDGCQHAVFEILSNSIDEAREGYGNQIIVTRYNDARIEVEDFGRGCPVDFNEKVGKYNWELVFCELYAGGKYDNNQGEHYEYSLGLNGLGACATQYASAFMDVTVRREGKRYDLHFEKGSLVGDLRVSDGDRKKTGTCTVWKPDLDVFTDINIPPEFFVDILRRQAVVNGGITFLFKNETETGFEETTFCYPNGIVDYIAELTGTETITEPVFWEAERRGRDRADKPDYKLKLSVAFCFSNRLRLIEHYHNSSWLEHGGSPEKAMRSAFLSAFDGWLKQNGKYAKNESKLTWADLQETLVFVSNNFSTQTSYENQTKKAVSNKFIQEAMTEFLRENLQIFLIENPQAAERVAEQLLINKRSREAGEKARLNLKSKNLVGSIDIANRVQKFVDCRTRDASRREIYIVEGDSALGACKMSRDAEFQGIMPIRGKILNCLKADYARIFKSDIIGDLLKVLGCGVEVQHAGAKDIATFNLSALRWNKVILCTDADVDGFQIRTLLLTMLYRLTPTLIREGYVYIVESPLYEIEGDNKTWFAYSDQEKNEIAKKNKDKKLNIQRSKGLGENEPEMMWLTTMNPGTRRLIRVMPADIEATAASFDLLLGDNLAGRKEHIAENGYKYLELADIS
ncbi:MAG: toprim domain-containing protein [Evtepia sp.]